MGKTAVSPTSPTSAAILYGMTPPSFSSVDSGIATQSMDVDSQEYEKGEKRTSQSMLTPPTDEKFKRQHVDKLEGKVYDSLCYTVLSEVLLRFQYIATLL